MKIDTNKLRFASDSETKKIFVNFPAIENLHINYDFKSDRHFESTDRFIDSNDFRQWLIRLLNKFNDIRFSYVQLAFSFDNGIPDENWKRNLEEGGTVFFEEITSEDHNVNKFLFDFFIECFYYHYFSSIDLLFKVLNKLFSINVEENLNGFNTQVLKRLKEKDFQLYNTIKSFNASIKLNRNYRNDFTHNYAVNKIDLRSKQTIKNGKRSITLMDPSYTTSKQLFTEIKKLVIIYVPVLKLIETTIVREEKTQLKKPDI